MAKATPPEAAARPPSGRREAGKYWAALWLGTNTRGVMMHSDVPELGLSKYYRKKDILPEKINSGYCGIPCIGFLGIMVRYF